ncbi:MAG: phosphatidylglycerophosphatase A [Pseudomonadales bacterium]
MNHAILPSFKQLLSKPVQLLALGFGSGLVPKAPGTWGSVAAVAIYLVSITFLPASVQLVVITLAFFLGVYLCGACAEALGVHDHGAIVWDEFVGQWLVLVYLFESLGARSAVAVVTGFALFRFFDIAKPWPIRWADRQVHGGFGIMLDDVLAAGMAVALLAALNAVNGLSWMGL